MVVNGFDGGFDADELLVGVGGAQVIDGVSGGGVTGNNDEVIGVVEIGEEGFFCEGLNFFWGSTAVGRVGGVNNLGYFVVWERTAKMVGENFTTGACVKNYNLCHIV